MSSMKFKVPENCLPEEVMITGIGILSPIGNSPAEVLSSLIEGRDGIGIASKIDVSKFSSKLCAEVKNFDFKSEMTPEELETFDDPYFRMAISSARLAMRDAGISPEEIVHSAAVLGTCNAGMNSAEAEYLAEYSNSSMKFDSRQQFESEYCALVKAVSSSLKIGGEIYLVSTACSSSTSAVGLAFELVRRGRCDLVLAGGADAVSLANYAGFNALKVVSPEKTAPFSLPVGMNIGEGACFWIMESAKRALGRGAACYGKVVGFATSGDAHHPTRPDPRGDGAYRTMRNALSDSGAEIFDIGCINAHGSGTEANDRSETKGIIRLTKGAEIPFTSTKSYHAHCMGATGIIEATCQLLSMNSDFVPPTLRNSGTRPGCEISAVGGAGLKKSYSCFLSANYAFAGSNSAIAVAKPDFKNFKPKNLADFPVITGCGMLTPFGAGEILSNNACESKEFKGGIAKVNLPNLRTFDRRIDFDGMNRIAAMATIAAKFALDEAGVRIRREEEESVGMVVGICRGSPKDSHMRSVLLDENRKGDIACFSNVTANAPSGWVSKAFGIKGENTTLASGYNCSLQALALSADMVRWRKSNKMVAISADEISDLQIKSYRRAGILFEGGPILSEGSAAVLLESEKSASERGAKILGKIISCASAADTCGFMDSEPTGVIRAACLALERAGRTLDSVDLIVSPKPGDFASPLSKPVLHPPWVGFAESSSALQALIFALKTEHNKTILCLSSGGITGNNFAVLIDIP